MEAKGTAVGFVDRRVNVTEGVKVGAAVPDTGTDEEGTDEAPDGVGALDELLGGAWRGICALRAA